MSKPPKQKPSRIYQQSSKVVFIGLFQLNRPHTAQNHEVSYQESVKNASLQIFGIEPGDF